MAFFIAFYNGRPSPSAPAIKNGKQDRKKPVILNKIEYLSDVPIVSVIKPVNVLYVDDAGHLSYHII